jgi:hypothetical protein
MLNAQTAQQALVAHANANTINASTVQALLANVSTTFANIVYVTKVATAAKHKAVNIVKVVSANVQLFSNINAFTSVYANAVKRTASNIDQNNASDVAQFTAQSNYFTHTACYSLVAHKQTQALYLYAIYNNASSLYYINNVLATKQQVAEYLTASAASALLANNAVVLNATHNVLHTVKVRTIALANLVSITANKQTVSVA